jgi:hypothetical protein
MRKVFKGLGFYVIAMSVFTLATNMLTSPPLYAEAVAQNVLKNYDFNTVCQANAFEVGWEPYDQRGKYILLYSQSEQKKPPHATHRIAILGSYCFFELTAEAATFSDRDRPGGVTTDNGWTFKTPNYGGAAKAALEFLITECGAKRTKHSHYYVQNLFAPWPFNAYRECEEDINRIFNLEFGAIRVSDHSQNAHTIGFIFDQIFTGK